MFTAITPTTIAKMALRQIVALNIANLANNAVEEYTEYDPDSITVQIGCAVVGHVVAMKTQRYTDAIVDTIATGLAARKDRKNPVTVVEVDASPA